jgi:hypothetical protein
MRAKGLGPSGCAQQMQNDGVGHKKIAPDSVFPGGLPPPTGRSYAINRHPSMAGWMTQAFQLNCKEVTKHRDGLNPNRRPCSGQIRRNDSGENNAIQNRIRPVCKVGRGQLRFE